MGADAIIFRDQTFLDGKKYNIILKESDVATTEDWQPLATQPPFSLSQASAAALAYIKSLRRQNNTVNYYTKNKQLRQRKDESDFGYEIFKISLINIYRNKWIYVIEIQTLLPNGLGGMATPVKLVVLMDGKIVEFGEPDGSSPSKGGNLKKGSGFAYCGDATKPTEPTPTISSTMNPTTGKTNKSNQNEKQ